jgi:hypothetical protein
VVLVPKKVIYMKFKKIFFVHNMKKHKWKGGAAPPIHDLGTRER